MQIGLGWVQREAMTHNFAAYWNRAEPVERVHLIRVILRQYFPYSVQSLFVLVLLATKIVQR